MISKHTLILVSLFVLSANNCGSPQRPGQIPAPADNDVCVTAEANLKIACPAVAAPTKKGKTFAQWCVETQDNGINMNPKCLARAKSCDDADRCLNDYSNLVDGGK
jgi:hypothetical protein